jgi:hypothetical protein
MDINYASSESANEESEEEVSGKEPSRDNTEQTTNLKRRDNTDQTTNLKRRDNTDQTTNLKRPHQDDFESKLLELQGLIDDKIVYSPSETDKLQMLGYLLRNANILPDTMLIPTQSGSPSPSLQTKIQKWTELKQQGISFNSRLLNTPAFLNPSITQKMIDFLEFTEYGSNYNVSIFDPMHFQHVDYKNLGMLL